MEIPEAYITKMLTYTGISEEADRFIRDKYAGAAKAVIGYLNGGGAALDPGNLTDHQLYVVSVGVNDLQNNNPGGTSYSPLFKELATQLCLMGAGDGNG